MYQPELDTCLADGRLTGLRAAFSRVKDGAYVQDRVPGDAEPLRQLLEQGGQMLVCVCSNLCRISATVRR